MKREPAHSRKPVRRTVWAVQAVAGMVLIAGCTPNSVVHVRNTTDRVLVIDQISYLGTNQHMGVMSEHARTVIYPADFTSDTSDSCNPKLQLTAVNLDGHEVARLIGACWGDEWTISNDQERPPVKHEEPRPHRAGDLQVQLRVPVDYDLKPLWVLSLDKITNELDRALKAEGAGFADGAFEEKHGICFYLYGPNQDQITRIGRKVLDGFGRFNQAYAIKTFAGSEATGKGTHVDLPPPPIPPTRTQNP